MAHFRQRVNNKNERGVLGKSFKIFQDENAHVSTFANKQQGTNSKRTVLGVLSANVDLKRDVIFGKPKVSQVVRKPFFTADSEILTSTTESNETFVELEKSQQQDVFPDSPMRIDKSFDETVTVSSSEQSGCDLTSYAPEIYQYMKELEMKIRPKPQYMRKQPDITHGMRGILVDWLVEVAEEYRLKEETLYLCVSYIDRFLSTMSVLRSKLQLVGTASMFIAAKYEEIYPPNVTEFVYITDDTYSKKQVLRMEQLILKVLSFDLAVPTPYFFLRCFCTWIKAPSEMEDLAEYICELSLMHADPYLRFLPSELACSALALANQTLDYETWSSELALRTGYDFNDFRECFECLHTTFSEAPSHPQQAIREKYLTSRYHSVAQYAPHPLPST